MSKIKIVSDEKDTCCHHVYVDGVEIHGVYEATLNVGLIDVCPSLELKVRATNNLAEVEGIVYAEVERPQETRPEYVVCGVGAIQEYIDVPFMDDADKERLINGDRTD